MSKKLVFVDESGDPGFKSTSSDNFVMAAAVFVEPKAARPIIYEMERYRAELGWSEKHEFKFTKTPKSIVEEMLRRICVYNFEIYAVYIDKGDFRELSPAIMPFFDKEKLNNWLMRELLRKIPLEEAKITIDGRSSKQDMQNAKTYLRRAINETKTKKIEISFKDSVRTDLLQLADLVAGAVYRSLQKEKTDAQKYIRIIDSKIRGKYKVTLR